MNSSTLQEWLEPSSIGYLSDCLQSCSSPEMVQDLRKFVPAEALREATKRLSKPKREQLKNWVVMLNASREVAA